MKRKIISLVIIGALSLSMIACKDSSSEEVAVQKPTEDAEEIYSYNITACLSEDNEYNKILLQGFTDAVNDYLGPEHVNISKKTVSEDVSADTVASKAIASHPDLIFTAGKQMLLSASAITDEIPIIATGIVDFQGTLRIADSGSSSWNKTTGINVTGVNSKPPIADQVSLMIEATPDLQAVGILFSPEDTDSIYQNEIFEKYLDQAGIPWKEYIIPATDAAIDEESDQNTEAITPSKFVATSAKSGMDNFVELLGEDLITGINSPASTRVASVSKHWTGGKIVEVLETESEEDSEEILDDNSDEIEEEPQTDFGLTDDVTLEERIEQACKECSAIYIPFGSMLADQAETICSVATNAGVSTLGGDDTIGQYSLVTLFYDPYSLGYSAGKKAIKVLDGSDITTMKIGSSSSDDVVKLYNSEVAEQFELTFPKSFHEIHEFLETYEYGSTTKRHEESED